MKTRLRFLLLFLPAALAPTLLAISCGDDSDDRPTGPSRPTMNKQDSLAIVAYYHSMKCAKWTGGFHWDLKDYTTWAGIYVALDEAKNEYRVKGIETPPAAACIPEEYSLPPELGNLTALEILKVWGDERAVGGIPPEIFNCPLRRLSILGNAHGGFGGTIPKEIGKVANTLESLQISGTSIGGEMPEEVGTLSKLESRANFIGNNFTGKVPLFLRNLPHGATLFRNGFTEMDWRYFTEDVGIIPDVMYNHLQGEIPEEVMKTERWKLNWELLYNQADGYGYDEKYFSDLIND